MKRLIGMTAALLLAATATSASARIDDISAADKADMQCFALTAFLAGQYEEGSPEQTGLASGMMYFLGRLEGRAPGSDWLKALADFILSLDDAQLESELGSQQARCGGILENRGQALVEWGETVQAGAEARGN